MKSMKLIIIGTLGITLLAAGIYFGVRAAYGAYGDYYYVTADFEQAGQQVQLGTDVRVRGVNVGKVVGIDLIDRHARLRLQIEEGYEIPADARAVITLKTFLGSKFVDLQFDPSEDQGPLLADGDRIVSTHTGLELEDALDDGTSVLAAIRPQDAAILVTELARAARGHGDDIARGLEANARLSRLFAATLDPQVQALEDFDVLFDALKTKGADLNALTDAINQGVPVYASDEAQAAMHRALVGLTSFSKDLGDLIIFNRRDWDRMMNAGDTVLSVVASHSGGLEDLVHGLYRYTYKLGQAIEPNLLPDGSAAAGFVNFVGGNDPQEDKNQFCDSFPPEERQHIPICAGSVP